jgi:hypothetical protein
MIAGALVDNRNQNFPNTRSDRHLARYSYVLFLVTIAKLYTRIYVAEIASFDKSIQKLTLRVITSKQVIIYAFGVRLHVVSY